MLNGLDLFSGIGGISIALSDWVRPIAYCEIDPYCQAVLLSKMDKGQINVSPIWDDIRSLNSRDLPASFVDVIYGGFPCQDISIAGNGKGLDGERSGLYWEIYRLAKEIFPNFIFLENVPAICTKGGWEIISSLTEIGYGCRWCTLSASKCGAKHKRERWFLLANTRREFKGSIQEPREKERAPLHPSRRGGEWEAEPYVDRVVDGVPFRVDRVRGLGNAVVPIQAKTAFKYLMGIK